MPKPLRLNRFVPSGEERNIGFVVALFPDCTSRGMTVGRVLKPPAHGTMTFAAAESFSSYLATSRLASCNDKKLPGLNIVYKSDDGYLGEDGPEIFLVSRRLGGRMALSHSGEVGLSWHAQQEGFDPTSTQAAVAAPFARWPG
jgi:hypothetical protein